MNIRDLLRSKVFWICLLVYVALNVVVVAVQAAPWVSSVVVAVDQLDAIGEGSTAFVLPEDFQSINVDWFFSVTGSYSLESGTLNLRERTIRFSLNDAEGELFGGCRFHLRIGPDAPSANSQHQHLNCGSSNAVLVPGEDYFFVREYVAPEAGMDPIVRAHLSYTLNAIQKPEVTMFEDVLGLSAVEAFVVLGLLVATSIMYVKCNWLSIRILASLLQLFTAVLLILVFDGQRILFVLAVIVALIGAYNLLFAFIDLLRKERMNDVQE